MRESRVERIGDATLYLGDALACLREMAAESVHCVVTSPPYWGLRDYGTGTWEGGSAECDHRQYAYPPDRETPGGRGGSMPKSETVFKETCGKCGAKRTDQQLGLEATTELYVAKMVEVFREVMRVLRDDGTCFVNLGDSYASGAKGHVLSCGICGTELADCPAHDSTSIHLCDGCQADLFRRTIRNGSQLVLSPADDSRDPIREHTESALDHLPMMDSSVLIAPLLSFDATLDHSPSGCHEGGPLPSSRESTPPESSSEFSDHASIQCREEADRVGDPTSVSCAPPSEHKGQHNPDREAMLSSFASRISGTDHSDVHVCPYPHYTTACLKSKDLCGIPWRLAFALQADGWYLRSDIIWHKPNPMPESVTDRPTKAHEYVFLLSKSARYFWDAEAIKEACESGPSDVRKMIESLPRIGGKHKELIDPLSKASAATNIGQKRSVGDPSGRNARTVWTIATQPYSGAHFATFPEELARRCIAAGTSERGCCPTCGAPWVRVVERTGGPPNNRFRDGLAGNCKTAHTEGTVAGSALSELYRKHGYPTVMTTGWRPTCDHGLEPVPCTVLDPFAGAGTALLVAQKMGRKAIGVELKPEYVEMARERLVDDAPLFAEAAP